MESDQFIFSVRCEPNLGSLAMKLEKAINQSISPTPDIVASLA